MTACPHAATRQLSPSTPRPSQGSFGHRGLRYPFPAEEFSTQQLFGKSLNSAFISIFVLEISECKKKNK